jgi:hypothetical protein
MVDLNRQTVISGFITAVLIFVITLSRQRRLDGTDLGSLAVGFFAGSNLPAALFLCYYVFDPDPPSVQTKLHGYEKYIAFAGLAFLFISVVTIWTICKKAYTKP